MDCQNCELKQRQFFCENCLKQHLLSLRLQTQHASADRDIYIGSAHSALATVVDSARLRRADLRGREERVQEVWEALKRLRSTNDELRERAQILRSTLAARRRTLAVATSNFRHPHGLSAPSPSTSPPHASAPTSSQAGGSTPQRPNSLLSSHSSTPFPSNPSSVPRSTARTLGFFTSTSPQSARTSLSAANTPPQSYLRPSLSSTHAYGATFGRTSGSPYGTLPSARNVDVVARQIDDLQSQMVALSDIIVRARSGLVQELVEVFSVVEVGGRPPLGGRAGTKGEWTIGGLVLPVPGDIRRYPPDHMNAVLTHTVHFVTLLAFYLGIKLPFEIVWSRSQTPPSTGGSGLLGVGIPWIGAIRGGESGGWARWSTKQPLHVSSAPPPASPNKSPSQSSPTASRPSAQRSSTAPASTASTQSQHRTLLSSSSLADSQLADALLPSTSSPGGAFTTALAMLLYDVCYLAHTQGVDVPLAHAGDVLGNLWAVCCSPELGRRAHATHPLLPPPTPAGFPLDFSHLLQATAATPARLRARGTSGRGQAVRTERIVEEDEGWDLLDADTDLIV